MQVQETFIFNVLGNIYREFLYRVSLSTAGLSHTNPAFVCIFCDKSRAKRQDGAQVLNYCGTAGFYRRVQSVIVSKYRTLKLETKCFCETLVPVYQNTRRFNI